MEDRIFVIKVHVNKWICLCGIRVLPAKSFFADFGVAGLANVARFGLLNIREKVATSLVRFEPVIHEHVGVAQPTSVEIHGHAIP